jgi:hypothetical protein
MIKATIKLNLNPNFIAEVMKVAEEKVKIAFPRAKFVIVNDKPRNSTE